LDLQKQHGEATKWSHSLLEKFWHHLHPGHRQPRGLQKQQRQDPPEWAPPLEEEDEKPKIGGPTKGISHKSISKQTTKYIKMKNKKVNMDKLQRTNLG
jgi:hypothetical protein